MHFAAAIARNDWSAPSNDVEGDSTPTPPRARALSSGIMKRHVLLTEAQAAVGDLWHWLANAEDDVVARIFGAAHARMPESHWGWQELLATIDDL
jgi:hypothetical protein